MAQAVGVAQFVYRLLDRPLVEQGLVIWQAVQALTHAGEGDDGCRPAHLRLTEDEVEARRIQIHIDNGQPSLGGEAQAAQLGQDIIREILPSMPVVSPVGVKQGGWDHVGPAERLPQAPADDGQDGLVHLANGD